MESSLSLMMRLYPSTHIKKSYPIPNINVRDCQLMNIHKKNLAERIGFYKYGFISNFKMQNVLRGIIIKHNLNRCSSSR